MNVNLQSPLAEPSAAECPKCGSPKPHLHPAVQFEGEVQPCDHEFHEQATPQNLPSEAFRAAADIEEETPILIGPNGPAAKASEGIKPEPGWGIIAFWHPTWPHRVFTKTQKHYWHQNGTVADKEVAELRSNPQWVEVGTESENADLRAEVERLKGWRDAITEANVVNWSYKNDHDDNPTKALADLMSCVMRETLDPQISEPAAKLHSEIERLRNEIADYERTQQQYDYAWDAAKTAGYDPADAEADNLAATIEHMGAEVERLKADNLKLHGFGDDFLNERTLRMADRELIERLTRERDEAREKFDKLKLALGTDRYSLAVEIERLTQALAKARFELFKDATDILDPLIPTLGGSVTLGDIALAVKEKCERLTRERDALQRFKDFVHSRLDKGGVLTHIDGPHSKEGCRIGDRLDWVFDKLDGWRQAAEWFFGYVSADLASCIERSNEQWHKDATAKLQAVASLRAASATP